MRLFSRKSCAISVIGKPNRSSTPRLKWVKLWRGPRAGTSTRACSSVSGRPTSWLCCPMRVTVGGKGHHPALQLASRQRTTGRKMMVLVFHLLLSSFLIDVFFCLQIDLDGGTLKVAVITTLVPINKNLTLIATARVPFQF